MTSSSAQFGSLLEPDGLREPEELGGALSAALSGRLSGEVGIEELARLSGGASPETWAFHASAPDGVRHAFIQREDFEGSAARDGSVLVCAAVQCCFTAPGRRITS